MENDIKQERSYSDLPFQLLIFDEKTDDELHLTPMHWHKELEITVTIRGKGEASIDDQKYIFSHHNIFIINPESLHYVNGYQPLKDNIGYCLKINMDPFYPIFPELNKRFLPTCNDYITEAIISQVSLLHEDISHHQSPYQLINRIIKILEILSQQKTTDVAVSSNKNRHRVLKITEYIQNHYQDDCHLDDIAEHFHLSKGHLQKIFKDHLHQSVYAYITEIRMQHALDDLKYTDYPIIDIALKNGFPNSKSFVKEFKKYFQMTPNDYRKGR